MGFVALVFSSVRIMVLIERFGVRNMYSTRCLLAQILNISVISVHSVHILTSFLSEYVTKRCVCPCCHLEIDPVNISGYLSQPRAAV